MTIESLRIGMVVKHPQYGEGTVRALNASTAEIQFGEGTRTVAPDAAGLEPAEPSAAISGLDVPLAQLLRDTVQATVAELGLEKPEDAPTDLAGRWHEGRLVLHPADPSMQTKEVPMETFFHKIVMVRNNLRVLEQKVNASNKLAEADKVELQQYITRCYGSLTTFNVLFKDKEDHF